MTALGDLEASVEVFTAAEVADEIAGAGGGGAGEVVLSMVKTATALTITSQNTASPETFITADAITLDGSTDIWIEFYCPYALIQNPGGSQESNMYGWIYDGSTKIKAIWYRTAYVDGGQSFKHYNPIYRKVFLAAPAAGSHTYSIRVNKSANIDGFPPTANISCGDDGVGNWAKAYIRITVANPVEA